MQQQINRMKKTGALLLVATLCADSKKKKAEYVDKQRRLQSQLSMAMKVMAKRNQATA